MSESSAPIKCTMYACPFSLYSIMARFTATLGATTGPPAKNISMELQMVDIFRDKNIDEWYLKINPKGQVSAAPSPPEGCHDGRKWLTADIRFRP